ncbi:MAG: nitroreductase family protein [Acutalibacteraceae bacterium]
MQNEVLDVLKNRRAIRIFQPKQITAEELNAVLQCGIYAPTACGRQSPVVIAVQDSEAAAKVAALNGKFTASQSNPYYGAPTILLVLYDPDLALSDETAVLDCAAVCTNMLNAAEAVGLGSCWIHRCHDMFECAEGKALLRQWGLKDTLHGVASIALGYADCEKPKPRARKADYIVRI